MLEISGLRAFYGGIEALKGIDLTVQEGAIITIIGANGAGKSTLLKSICGLIRSKEGKIVFMGRDISSKKPGQIVKLGLSLSPEGRQLFSHLTVEDNLNLGAYVYFKRKNKSLVNKNKNRIFELFPVLEERLMQLSGTLSGGEQQMLAIARAMMAGPKLLALDEPSMGLAPLFVREIFEVLKTLNKEGATILLVEQNARAALKIAQHGYIMETGAISMQGPTEQLLENEEIRRAYLGAQT